MGSALKNVNARLKGYFGSLSGLEIQSVEGEGTTAVLRLCDALAGDGDGEEELTVDTLGSLLGR